MSQRNNFIGYAICVLGLTMAFSTSYAQPGPPSTASLLLRLKQSPADTSRIQIIKAIVNKYRNNKPDSGLFYTQQGLALAKELNYPLGIGIMQGQIGAIDIAIGKMSEAKSNLTAALVIFKELKYETGLVTAHNSLGICLAKMGSYPDAAENFMAALKINQAKNDTHGLVQSYLKMGVLNEQINNEDKALDYYKKALELNKKLPPSNAESSILNSIGIVYGKKGQLNIALQYFLDGIRKIDDHEPELTALLLGNAGNAYQQLGNIKKAYELQLEALALARKANLPEAEATTLVNLASLKIKVKPDTSLILLKQSLAITKMLHQSHLQLDVYDGLIEVYKQKGNFKEALATLETKNTLKDSLFTLKSAKEIAGLQANNDLANSKIKVQQLKLTNQQSKFQTLVNLSVAVCALVILAIVFLFYAKTRKLNKQLMQQQSELKDLNSFKDKLFSIISHDLRSPVATIVNLLSVFDGEEDAAEVRSYIPRLKEHSASTLDVMDKLLLWGQTQLKGISSNKTYFNAKEIIVQSLNLHKETADQKNIKLIDSTPNDVRIFAERSNVDFIIRNLLANAVKYTRNGGTVEVEAVINEPKGYNTIAVKDNGIGIAQSLQHRIFEPDNQSMRGTESEKGNSIGLMLCKEFVEINGGKIWVESELDKGTNFYVSFKQ